MRCDSFSCQILIVILLAMAIGAAGCSTATPTETPGVERISPTVLRYTGPETMIVFGYRFAKANPAEEWLLLDVAITGNGPSAVELDRGDIFVLTPSGTRILLATQQQFGAAYGQLQSLIVRADAAADSLDYFPGRRPCQLRLFAAPGTGVPNTLVSLNDQRVCSGRLFFQVPAGVQQGRWVLGIDLPETDVRIPFEI
jgi:hypothetical protein